MLAQDEPLPAEVVNRSGASPFLLIGDHAGNAIPRALGDLGVGLADRRRHIAWDIGTQALGMELAARLDATFVWQVYSRLVIDCNRDPARADAMPEESDGSAVPGNRALGAEARAARIAAIHAPYQQAIAVEIARRRAAGQPTALVSLHSFTPRLAGGPDRPWTTGILHDGHADAFARALLAALGREPGEVVGDNEPYRMDGTDHTVPRHAFRSGLSYAEIEVRQDRIGDAAGVARAAALLARGLHAAWRAVAG